MELIAWFSRAEIGDQCHVITQNRQTYMFLTKLSPVAVQWKMPVASANAPGVTGSMAFLELLQSWEGELAQV
jgi:hypothetical protein